VLFASGQAVLNPDSVRVLSAVAKVLGTVENPIQVEGHTDNMPISTPVFPSNWELSSARASSVVRLFVEQGVKPDRLVAVGYGDNHPVEGNETPDGRSRNRRVAIMIHAESEKKITEIPITGSPYQGSPAQ
jgi:chemotaxis protein MotB